MAAHQSNPSSQSFLQSRVNWTLLTISILLALCLRFLPTLTPSSPPPPSNTVRYVVLIDAGSSGSRIHVHPYTLPSPSNVTSTFPPLPLISPSFSLKVKPGLSSFSSPSIAAESLLPLLTFALSHVPPHLHSSTPLFLYATAGLRTIPLIRAEEILTACRSILSSSPFLLQSSNVRIISGVQEGINGWIAANYLLGHFNSTSPSPPTVGVLEMGGASFQLTFAPRQPDLFPPFSLIPLTLAQYSFSIYTISYLNYGLEKAQELYMSKHSQIIGRRDPCYPVGTKSKGNAKGHYAECVELVDQLIRYDITHQTQEEMQKASPPSQQDEWENPSLPPSSSSPSSSLSHTAHTEGGHLIDCHSTPCTFSGHFIPPISPSEPFLAIENFYYTSEFFQLLSPDSPFDAEGMRGRGREYCEMSWEDIEDRWPNEPKEDLQKYCFSAAYLPRVLEVGLGMGEVGGGGGRVEVEEGKGRRKGEREASEEEVRVTEELQVEGHTALKVETEVVREEVADEGGKYFSNVRITKHINGVAIDWALGAVLLEVINHLHADLYATKGVQQAAEAE